MVELTLHCRLKGSASLIRFQELGNDPGVWGLRVRQPPGTDYVADVATLEVTLVECV